MIIQDAIKQGRDYCDDYVIIRRQEWGPTRQLQLHSDNSLIDFNGESRQAWTPTQQDIEATDWYAAFPRSL